MPGISNHSVDLFFYESILVYIDYVNIIYTYTWEMYIQVGNVGFILYVSKGKLVIWTSVFNSISLLLLNESPTISIYRFKFM